MTGLIEQLRGEVTALAMCWRLTRSDGVVLGFTSHDRDISLAGLVYRANPGMTPSAVSQGDALKADSMDIAGVLGASAITAFDLEVGRWTGARVELLACDWHRPEAGMLGILAGTIGEVASPFPAHSGLFQAELLSEAHKIDLKGPPRLSPNCRAELGDGRCGIDMDGRQTDVRLAGGSGDSLDLVEAVPEETRFAGGRIRLLDGRLCGIERRIAAIYGLTVLLEEALDRPTAAGVRVRLWEGCDKRLVTCGARFANAAAFDGEPHVPGTDALLRYAES